MMDQPSITELVTAVREFLETKAMPELREDTAFSVRSAVNALAMVGRSRNALDVPHQPSIVELVSAARKLIETEVMLELKGHTAFHARVAANALGIVARQLELYGRAYEEERVRMISLLGHGDSLENLNRELCARIRSGAFSLDTPGLAAHLEQSTRDKVAIDQPNYSGLKQALARD